MLQVIIFKELKKDFNSCQSENQRLKVENEQLLQKCSILQKEVDTLKKRLDRKEIALLKNYKGCGLRMKANKIIEMSQEKAGKK